VGKIKEIRTSYKKGKEKYINHGLGNKVLYRLCIDKKSELYGHRYSQVRAKIWLIGRAYAASLERGNIGQNGTREKLYEKVINRYCHSNELNNYFRKFKNKKYNALRKEDTKDIMKLFNILATKIFKEKENKYSLASKYLHFHFPESFFIYDSISNRQVTHLCSQLGRKGRLEGNNVYEKYFNKCVYLIKELEGKYKLKLNKPTKYKTRNLDVLLQHIGRR